MPPSGSRIRRRFERQARTSSSALSNPSSQRPLSGGLALRLARKHLRDRPSGLVLPRLAHHGNALPDPTVGMRAAGVFPFRPAGPVRKRRLRRPSDLFGGRAAELLAPVAGQRPDPDPPLRPPPPRGPPGKAPAGGPVARARMPGPGVRAGRQGTDAVRRLPVSRKALRRQGQNPRGQIPNPDARKDQEAVVLHQPPEIRRPRPRTPADERVARLRMPAGGLEADPAQTAAPLRDDPVAQPRPRRQGRALRMPPRHHRPPGPDLRRAVRRLEPDRPEIAERRLDPRIRNRVRRDAPGRSRRRTPRSAARPGSARRAEARQNSPFALRQSATSHRPRAKEPRVRPSSDAASRNQTPMPAPNRRCSFSMTSPP